MAKRRKAPSLPIEPENDAEQASVDALWTSLSALVGQRGYRKILFTSVEPSAGTTLIAAQSVAALVRNTRKSALLVELDIESPTLARYVGVPTTPGLAEFLDGTRLERVATSVEEVPGLTVIPGGGPREMRPGELASELLQRELPKLVEKHDTLFIDAPPILTHPEMSLVLPHVEGVVLVLRARSSPKDSVRRVERLLGDAGVPIVGAVLNRYRSDMPFGLE
ncbi:MAG: CpsD/CapB family tyrosine-protein kinase [Planctomycetota bacterium]